MHDFLPLRSRIQLAVAFCVIIVIAAAITGCEVKRSDDCMPFPDNHPDHHRPSNQI